MTTKDKGITLPSSSSFNDVSAAPIKTTDTSNDYTVKQAWNYGPGYIIPNNIAPLTAVIPLDYTISGQNATALLSAVGGNIQLRAGVGVGGGANVDGNVIIRSTATVGGAWNTTHLMMGGFHFWLDAKFRLRMKATAPTADTDGNVVSLDLIGSATYDPPSLVDGAGVTTTVAVAGCGLGDMAICSFSLDLQGITVTAYVSAANVVSVRFQNESTGTIDLASGTLSVKVIKL